MMNVLEILAAAGVPAPISHSDNPDELGVLVDAAGRDFLTIDPDRERSDADVEAIARALVEAVNAACVPVELPAAETAPQAGGGVAASISGAAPPRSGRGRDQHEGGDPAKGSGHDAGRRGELGAVRAA